MDKPSNTAARSSTREEQARELYELLLATTEAMRALRAALYEGGDDLPEEFRELSMELFEAPSQVVALALQIRVIWPEVASSSAGVAD